MNFWVLVAQLFVFFFVLKVAQVVFWNVRRKWFVHPWVMEFVAGILVLVLVYQATGWWAVILFGVLFGVLRGDQDEDAKARRQLL
jgi:NAD(P) transhydrogenase subunit alpha